MILASFLAVTQLAELLHSQKPSDVQRAKILFIFSSLSHLINSIPYKSLTHVPDNPSQSD